MKCNNSNTVIWK